RGLREELEEEFPRTHSHLADALCYCDMNTTPDGTPTNPVDRVNEIAGRYGPDSLIGTFIRRAEPEILASTARVIERLATAKRQPM
ncbi:phosphohydrolase, partial [Streptomyces sp. JAC18]